MDIQHPPLTSSQQRIVIAGYFTSFLAVGMATASLGPALPYLAEKAQVSLSAISILFASRSVGRIIGALLSGRLFDRFPGHPLLLSSLLVLGLTTALIPLPGSLWGLTLVSFLNGIAQSMIIVGGNTLLVWIFREKIAPWMNGLHLFFGLGSMISPMLFTWIFAAGGGLDWAFASIALLMLPACLIMLRAPAVYPQPAADGERPKSRALPGMVLLIALFFFSYAGTLQAFGGWIYTYALKTDIAGPQIAGAITSLYWGVFTFSRLLAIPLSRRLRSKTILWNGLTGSLISILFLLLIPGNELILWFGTVLLGFSIAPIFAAMIAFIEPKIHINARISSWFNVGHSLGFLSIPWLVGQFFESSGPQVLFIIILFTLLAGVGIFLLLLRSNKEQASISAT